MVYRFLKILMTVALRFFYRKIYVTGMEVIPAKGPAILLANHPSALMDAALIGILLKREVYFFTKGDVFVNKTVNYILNALHMIPIHDHEGGRSTVHINDESYHKAEQVLSRGGIVLFFPEGNSKTHHKLMPLRKGVFRMAFQAAVKNDFSYDIPFIPVGINYEHPISANKDVMVHFNNPFYLFDYKEDFKINAAATMLQMAKDGFEVLEKKVLHIRNPDNFEVAEQSLIIHRNNYVFFTKSWLQATIRRFDLEKYICNKINSMEQQHLDLLKKRSAHYFNELKKNSLEDDTVASGFYFSNYKKWQIILGAPFYFISWVMNALPIIMGKRITDKNVHRLDFYSWILVLSRTFLYLFWIIALALGFSIIGWKYAIGIALFTLLTGIFYYSYQKWYAAYKQYRQLKKQKKGNPELLLQLQMLREELLFTSVPL